MAQETQQSDNKLIRDIHEKVISMATHVERAQISDYIQLLNRPWKIIYMNFLGGIARGVGIAIGFTIFASTIVYVLQMLGALNIPIIGKYIAEIVKHVQYQLEGTRYY